MAKKQAKPEEKGKHGRPTNYEPRNVDIAYELCRDYGLIDAALARALKTNKQTLYDWQKQHPEFAAAIKQGKEEFDTGKVEKALLRRALGYRYKEKTKEVYVDPDDGKRKLDLTKEVAKHIAPDPVSMIFWLKNRHPDRWKDMRNVEHGGGVTINHISNVDEALLQEDEE